MAIAYYLQILYNIICAIQGLVKFLLGGIPHEGLGLGSSEILEATVKAG